MQNIEILSFSNKSKNDRTLLKEFVNFHWKHYENDEKYIPLLDYEYLGFKLIGMTGFFEPANHFFKHGKAQFFIATIDGEMVGRCIAFINENHNKRWEDNIGFIGQFESIDDQEVANELFAVAEEWLTENGMDTIRGPQNFPVNEATPGLLTKGFESRPVIYYQYNKPYYEQLFTNAGFEPVKRVLSWEAPVMKPIEEKLERVAQKVIDRYNVKIEQWGDRPLATRKKEMLEIYNDAWHDNFGFVPFEQDEFYSIVEDMLLVMDKGLFIFLYLEDEPVAFFGGVPNVMEKVTPSKSKLFHRVELLRAIKLLFAKNSVKGFRLGYLGVKRKYRRLGLDGVMLWKQKVYAQQKGYDYCDLGWVLEDNVLVHRLAEIVSAVPSKTYTIFQKKIDTD